MAHHATQSTVLLKFTITIQYPCAHARDFYFLQDYSGTPTKEFNLPTFCHVV